MRYGSDSSTPVQIASASQDQAVQERGRRDTRQTREYRVASGDR